MSIPASKAPVRTAFGIDIPLIEIFDVGARIEGVDRYASLFAQELASVTGFEPNPPEFERLQALKAPRRRYFPYFLGRGGPAIFHLTRYPGCSSLYDPDPALIDLYSGIGATLPGGNFAVTERTEVQTTRLDDIPDLPVCDYLKIDIQGGEYDVLDGGAKALAQALVLEVEVEFVPMYKRQPLFGDIQILLREQNFMFHKFIDCSGRAMQPLQIDQHATRPMSQLLWADAIFVRNFVNLANWSNDQLLKAAAILYDVYNSHDLVNYLLTEYDRRSNTKLSETYLRSIAVLSNLPLMFLNIKTD